MKTSSVEFTFPVEVKVAEVYCYCGEALDFYVEKTRNEESISIEVRAHICEQKDTE
jgi:hypothetical protein